MKHLSIIVPEGSAILDTIIGTLGLFRMANAHLKRTGKMNADKFAIDLVGISEDTKTYNRFFQVKPTASIEQVKKTDLIIVSGISGNLLDGLEKNAPFVDWIKRQRIEHGAEIASLCKGAFLLADTGLLNGKSCATHWTIHDLFKEKFPQVNLIPEKIISEDNGIYSSGGAYSFLNLILYLIERHYGRDTAIFCSKVSEVDFDRSNQNQFIIFNGQKEHADEAIKLAQLFIEENFEEKLSVDSLAKKYRNQPPELYTPF